MDKKTHKRQDTPILRDRSTKKRLLAYELHIQTHELSWAASRQIREENRGITPELRTRSLPLAADLKLQKVVFEGREFYVRSEDLIPAKFEDLVPEPKIPEPNLAVTPNARNAAHTLLDLKPTEPLGTRNVSCPESQTPPNQKPKPS
jgi:hypothetical protein